MPLRRLFQPVSIRRMVVAAYELGESSGTRADATGRGNDLDTNTGTPGNTTGKVGNALAVANASSQSVSRASTADLQMSNGTPFWIALWANATTLSGTRSILGKGNGSSGTDEYNIDCSGTTLRFVVHRTTGDWITLNGPTLSTATWYFVVARYDGMRIFISVNAGTESSTAQTGKTNTATQAFMLGNLPSQSRYFDGTIDQVLVGKGRLSDAHRSYLYNGGNGRTYTELM